MSGLLQERAGYICRTYFCSLPFTLMSPHFRITNDICYDCILFLFEMPVFGVVHKAGVSNFGNIPLLVLWSLIGMNILFSKHTFFQF